MLRTIVAGIVGKPPFNHIRLAVSEEYGNFAANHVFGHGRAELFPFPNPILKSTVSRRLPSPHLHDTRDVDLTGW